MLQKAALLPALGTADAFHTVGIHKIGSGGSRKAVGTLGAAGLISELQLQLECSEAVNQPLAGFAVSLMPLTRSVGPDQGIGEAALMQNSLASTGPSHQRQCTC